MFELFCSLKDKERAFSLLSKLINKGCSVEEKYFFVLLDLYIKKGNDYSQAFKYLSFMDSKIAVADHVIFAFLARMILKESGTTRLYCLRNLIKSLENGLFQARVDKIFGDIASIIFHPEDLLRLTIASRKRKVERNMISDAPYKETMRYEGEIKEDLFEEFTIHGYGRLKYKNGSIHEGQFQEGQAHGLGILLLADGTVYQGQFCKGGLVKGEEINSQFKKMICCPPLLI